MKIFLFAFFFSCFTLTNAFAHEGDKQLDIAHPEKVIMKIEEKGLTPGTLVLHQNDASVFLVNTTQSSLFTVDIDFGKHKAHCASGNLKFLNEGVMTSSVPVAPKDFALLCFPEKGTYPVSVTIGKSTKPLKGTIIVE